MGDQSQLGLVLQESSRGGGGGEHSSPIPHYTWFSEHAPFYCKQPEKGGYGNREVPGMTDVLLLPAWNVEWRKWHIKIARFGLCVQGVRCESSRVQVSRVDTLS